MPVTTHRHRPDRHHRVARARSEAQTPGQRHHHRPASASSASASRSIRALLRLTPSAAVATSGPAGSLTEVRIRGAEANHTLLFVDGIKINDPASGDTPRFELLNADLASRIEVVRGPQSALWGSEAIGGVIAVNGIDDAPGDARQRRRRLVRLRSGRARPARIDQRPASIAGAVGLQRATGIDSFGGPGRQGRLSQPLGPAARHLATRAPDVELGAAALALDRPERVRRLRPVHRSPTPTRSTAAATASPPGGSGRASAATARRGAAQVARHRCSARRTATISPAIRSEPHARHPAQPSTRSSSGASRPARSTHRLIVAAETERETFHARDTVFGGFTDQDRDRAPSRR